MKPQQTNDRTVSKENFIRAFFDYVTNAGAKQTDQYDTKLEISKGINILTAWAILINIITGPALTKMTGDYRIIIGAAIELLCLIPIFSLNRQRRFRTANLLFFFVMNTSMLYFGLILGKSVGITLMAIFLAGLTMFVFTNKKHIITSATTTFLILIMLEYNYKHSFVPPVSANSNTHTFMEFTALCVMFSLVVMVFHFFAKIKNKNIAKEKEINKSKSKEIAQVKDISESKTFFIRSFAHEMKTYVYHVCFACGLLESKDQDVPNEQKMFILKSGSENLQRFVENMLIYSKLDAGKIDQPDYKRIETKWFIDNALNLSFFIHASEKEITLRLDKNFPATFVTDPTKFQIILNNLISNAVKFTTTDTPIVISFQSESTYWCVGIENSGNEIPKNEMQEIFKPFVTKRIKEINKNGSGIGLYVTKNYVENMNGKISVYSENGVTRFTVMFPYSNELLLKETA
ncbi:HAMP domain-containing histidine kinase [Chitinophaga oryzae]|uniref:HAMP domain-containing histidine kinase n=1 Tax=Chitinophaga oryzae TaxID=2725414 RepID=A0AAE6ZLE7_9BACT|nr:HAMP domain-containing sensor histidine kinase [Chitinophaga oryzae]QJB34897.1 HAMP domain-containing histidine kinase [Chitinophaga oryzae]QJB41408.1 HAMP domain-containing histidine kinase [Chitinophaga oryzae]